MSNTLVIHEIMLLKVFQNSNGQLLAARSSTETLYCLYFSPIYFSSHASLKIILHSFKIKGKRNVKFKRQNRQIAFFIFFF